MAGCKEDLNMTTATDKATCSIHATDFRSTVADALMKMQQLQTDWLAVTREGVVIGIVKQQDLLRVDGGPALHQRVEDVVQGASADLVWLHT